MDLALHMVELLVVLLYLHIQQLKYVKVVVEDMVTENQEVRVDLVVVALDIMDRPTPLVEQVIGEMVQINQLRHQFLTKVILVELVLMYRDLVLEELVEVVVLGVLALMLHLAITGILVVQVESEKIVLLQDHQ